MQRDWTSNPIFWITGLLMLSILGPGLAQGEMRTTTREDRSARPLVLAVEVTVRDSMGTAYYADMVKEVIQLKPGQPFDPDQLVTSLEFLRQCQRFRDIHIDTQEREGGVILLVEVTPFSIVKDIRFKITYPLFEQDLLNAMAVHVGDAYRGSDLAAQEALLAQLYKKNGYVDPLVTITEKKDPTDGLFVFDVDVKRGAKYVLGRLTVNGNQAFSKEIIQRKLKIWRGNIFGVGRFYEERLKLDIKNLIAFYRRKGFADIKIDYDSAYHQGSNQVDVTLDIQEGDRYDIRFEGHQQFWKYTLKKDLLLFKSGNRRGVGIVKSVKAIKSRYHRAGYLETAVTIEETERQEKGIKVRGLLFRIDEGPRSQVVAIDIHGNHHVDDKAIRDQMLTTTSGFLGKRAYVPETLEEDIFAIQSLYMKYGFSQPRIDHEVSFNADRSQVTIDLTIAEGVRTILRSIEIEGLETIALPEKGPPLRLKVGEPLRSYMVAEDEKSIQAMVSEQGYPHVRVDTEVAMSEDRARADIIYRVDPGPKVVLGQIYMRGNLKTKDRILTRELETEPGEPFSMQKIVAGQHHIRNLGTFDSVQFKSIGLKEKSDTINLFIDVEEKKPYYFQVGGGFESDRRFFARGMVGNRNLFGTNKNLWAGGEVSEIGYRLESGLAEPRFLGTRIGADLNIFNERKSEFNQDFGTDIIGTTVGFSRDWWRERLTTALIFRHEYREQFALEPIDPDESEQYEPRSILVTTPLIRYDARDSFVRPTKGYLGTVSVDISRGLINSLDDFYKYRLDLRYFYTPVERITVALLGRAGHIDPFSAESRVPDDQLFFLGGINDVRGFEENLLRFDELGSPVGGRSAVVGSLETRIDLGRNFELTFFYDTGKLWNTKDTSVEDSFRSSVGTGLRYITPIGAVGILYGHKLDPRPEEDPGRFHISIGYTF